MFNFYRPCPNLVKALDSVNHYILIAKLEKYGIKGLP